MTSSSRSVDFLPPEFKEAHELCFFFHDQLVEALGSGEAARIFHININLKTPIPPEIATGDGEAFIKWLKTNGYAANVRLLFYKQICAALLSDFLHFIYEALECSRKGKLTVAFALLRKPLKENLFSLEWMLAEPAEMIKVFESGADDRRIDAIPREKKIEIIAGAARKCRLSQAFPPEFLYELRYDKQCEHGLEFYFQRATHLNTTKGVLRTEESNFNFVFSGTNARKTQWTLLYSTLPAVMLHAVEVVEALLALFAKRKDLDLVPLRGWAGFLLWMKSDVLALDFSAQIARFQSMVNWKVDCPRCGNSIPSTDSVLRQFYKEGTLKCEECGLLITT